MRAPALLVALCAACAREPGPQAPPDTASSAACLEADVAFAPTLAPTAVPQVLRVTWETEVPGPAALRITLPDGRQLETAPGPAGTQHSALTLGVPASTEVTLEPLVETEDGWLCGAPLSARTGPLPASFPALSVDSEARSAPQLGDGTVLVPVLLQEESWVVALDADGRVVWSHQFTKEARFGTPTFRARPAPDGTGVVVNTQPNSTHEDAELIHIGWDGVERGSLAVQGGHTDWVQLPDGGVAMLGWDLREIDGRLLLGDTIELLSASGVRTTLWSSFDTFTPDLDRAYPQGFLPEQPDVEDWTHANGIGYDAREDALLVTVPIFEAVVRVQRETGAVDWVLSALPEVSTFTAAMDLLHHPHSVAPTPEGVVVFNRRDWISATDCSSVSWIALRGDEAVETARYEGPTCEQVGFLGSAEPFAGGTVVAWSSAGLLDVVDDDRNVSLRVRSGLGSAFAFATATGPLGWPQEP